MKPSEIEDKLIMANMAYAKGMPFMTDLAYDELWKKLRDIKPNSSILYHTANDPTDKDVVPHKRPLRGTNKALSLEDLKPFMTRHGANELILEPKYDGCAAVLYTGKDEHSDRLVLEGDGMIGRDVSHHLHKIFFSFEPKYLESIELIIPTTNWKPEYGSNPRNTVAGWLARKELPEINVVEAVSHNYGKLNASYIFDGDYDKLVETLLQLYVIWSKEYPLDGIMIKVADENKRIISGDNGTTFNWSIAWKPPISTKETSVTDIEWNVSRTGRVIPTVIYEPIELCETINSRATGNNAKWLKDKKIYVGSKIIVGKAGEIIPKILKLKHNLNVNLFISAPHKCPVCFSKLTFVGIDLMCDDINCIAQLNKRIEHFYSDKGMEVKSLGKSRIFDLLQDADIRQLLLEKPWGLLDPIYYNIQEKIKKILGQKNTLNYLESLMKIKGKKNALHFIAALGYPGLAYKTALKLFYYIKNGTEVSHIPKKAQSNFVIAMAIYRKVELELMNFNFDLVPQEPRITYCITGTLSSDRLDMIKFLEKYGWSFSNNITKYTDFLIIGDNPGRIKPRKAQELQVPTLDETTLKTILDHEDKVC